MHSSTPGFTRLFLRRLFSVPPSFPMLRWASPPFRKRLGIGLTLPAPNPSRFRWTPG